jgi:hypothetical protein
MADPDIIVLLLLLVVVATFLFPGGPGTPLRMRVDLARTK